MAKHIMELKDIIEYKQSHYFKDEMFNAVKYKLLVKGLNKESEHVTGQVWMQADLFSYTFQELIQVAMMSSGNLKFHVAASVEREIKNV